MASIKCKMNSWIEQKPNQNAPQIQKKERKKFARIRHREYMWNERNHISHLPNVSCQSHLNRPHALYELCCHISWHTNGCWEIRQCICDVCSWACVQHMWHLRNSNNFCREMRTCCWCQYCHVDNDNCPLMNARLIRSLSVCGAVIYPPGTFWMFRELNDLKWNLRFVFFLFVRWFDFAVGRRAKGKIERQHEGIGEGRRCNFIRRIQFPISCFVSLDRTIGLRNRHTRAEMLSSNE